MPIFGLWPRFKAQEILDAGETKEPKFYEAKLKTAEFYWTRIMPRSKGHSLALETGSNNLMQLDAEAFAF